ncbi:MAG: 5-oxoprolinase/urea amidolyase family protein [archaeon]
MAIEILDPGSFTTVQDLGRTDYQKYGIPPSGAIDPYSLQVANLLVGNERGEAALEATISGPTVEFREETWFAVTGPGWVPRLNDAEIPPWRSVRAESGDRLSFDEVDEGARAYVAVAGGIDVPSILGSKSTNVRAELGGFEGRALQAGDVLEVGEGATPAPQEVPERYRPDPYFDDVRVVLGPQDDHFTDAGIETFLDATFTVKSESDRMGIRFDGPAIEHSKGADIVSEGTAAGAVQVPENGQPIALLGDRQTTGGYAKIATVIEADLTTLAQMRPADEASFREVSLETAYDARERQLEDLSEMERLLSEEALIADEPIEREAEAAESEPTETGTEAAESEPTATESWVTATMPGEILTIHASEGDEVEAGDDLIVYEAMKMENVLTSPSDGVVASVEAEEGDSVNKGTKLLSVRQ